MAGIFLISVRLLCQAMGATTCKLDVTKKLRSIALSYRPYVYHWVVFSFPKVLTKFPSNKKRPSDPPNPPELNRLALDIIKPSYIQCSLDKFSWHLSGSKPISRLVDNRHFAAFSKMECFPTPRL